MNRATTARRPGLWSLRGLWSPPVLWSHPALWSQRVSRCCVMALVSVLMVSACAVGVGYAPGYYGPDGYGYVGGVYEPYGYDYGGWGGRYYVGPPRGGPRDGGPRGGEPRGGGGRGAPSIPSGPRGGGGHPR